MDGYSETKPWAGHRQWKCDECPWGPTTREDLMVEHVRTAHPGERDIITGGKELLGPTGQPITSVPTAPGPAEDESTTQNTTDATVVPPQGASAGDDERASDES